MKVLDTLIASADTVAADAYATTLFGMKPEEIAVDSGRRQARPGRDGPVEGEDRQRLTSATSCQRFRVSLAVSRSRAGWLLSPFTPSEYEHARRKPYRVQRFSAMCLAHCDPPCRRSRNGARAAEPSFPAVDAEPLSTVPPGAIVLHAGWQMRESAIVGDDGAAFSQPDSTPPTGTKPRFPRPCWARSCVTASIPIPTSA